MSETTEETVQDAVTEAPEPVEAPEPQATEQAAEPAADGQEKPKEKRGDRRFAALTARASAETRRADEAEAEVARMRELLAARDGDDKPKPAANLTEAQIEARVNQRLAEIRFAEERNRIVQAGVDEFGSAEWNDKTNIVAAMGLMRRPEFMEALRDLPNAHRVVAALADDADTLQKMAEKTPAAMAVAIGRLAAEVGVASNEKQEISKAPPPVKPVSGGRAAPPPDPAKMTPKEYIEFRNRTAPRHLGGQGKAA